MKIKYLISVLLLTCGIGQTSAAVPPLKGKQAKNVGLASEQIKRMVDDIEKTGKILSPRTTDKNGKTVYVVLEEWTSGFFPGSLWYLYELTGDEAWKNYGIKYTEGMERIKKYTGNHDIGFMIYCSFGNGYRLTKNPAYADVIVEAAKSLSTRFRPGAGIIQSWNANKSKDWICPVIIDNMMNLELLFEASKLSGDDSFRKIAVSHADQTLKNHYRKDNSCFHVVDYDPETGAIRHRQTAQGFSDSSSWSRGQAWGLYGYTMCFRYTQDKKYLQQAERIADFIFNHPRLPKDLIPYWDYDADKIPDEPRDVSAAAITASALYELYTYTQNKAYKKYADTILKNLSGETYTAAPGTNGNFVLMHSVGSIPHGAEVDRPVVYADYYYLEAIKRKHDIESGNGLKLTDF